jgi:hypothetical protein
MNIINALISLTSNNPSEVIEGKKYFFGFDAKLEIQKIAYAFFLDSYKPQGGETPSFDKLTKYEFFPGSLTGKRLCQELEAFLQSNPPLNPETCAKIQAFVALLKEAQALSTHIDLLRSSNLPLIFVAATGIDSSKEGYKVNLDSDQLQALTASAIEKVSALKLGEKALFLTGSSLHETLVCIERKDADSFKFSIYDSATTTTHCVFKEELCKKEFWNALYSIKFSPCNSQNNLLTLVQQTHHGDGIEKNQRENLAALRQRKNTCHFRCLLAFLKDQIIGQSPLELNDACAEWQLFKKAFGEFLLKKPDLQDELLIHFSQKKQKARSEKQERADAFLTCIKEGKGKETFQCYQSLLTKLKKFEEPTSKDSTADPLLNDLLKIEKELIRVLESYPITPEELAPFLQEVNNPWVVKSLKLFTERFERRQKIFQVGLGEELANVEPYWKGFTFSSTEKPNPSKEAAKGLAFDQTKVKFLLDLFEKDPKKIHSLKEKPHCMAVLVRAIQLGYIEQVERITLALPSEDRQLILELFAGSNYRKFFIPTLPATATEQFIHHHLLNENFGFSERLSLMFCLRALSEGQILEAAQMYKIRRPHSKFRNMVKHLISNSSEDEILRMLSSIKNTEKESELIKLTIETIIDLFIETKNMDLIEKAINLDYFELNMHLNQLKFVIFYNNGEFEKIKNISIKDEKFECLLKEFDLGETENALNFINKDEYNLIYNKYINGEMSAQEESDYLTNDDKITPECLKKIIYKKLINFACKYESEEKLYEILEQMAKTTNFIENYKWDELESESIIFIIKTLDPNFDFKEKGYSAALLAELVGENFSSQLT